MLGPGRWLAWLRRRRRDHDIDEEIRAHLEMATRERIERGDPPDEARFAALREFGNVLAIRQRAREVWSWTMLEQLVLDVRLGVRILWQSPGLSAAAVLLVALVIGGNTTIYSIVNSLLVSPARGVTAGGLVAIKHVDPGVTIADPFVSYPNYQDYARLSTSVARLAAWSDERLTLGTATGNYAVFGALVTTNYFDTLGVAVVHGRPLGSGDDEAREGVAAVISDRLWHERFSGAPDVVGRTLTVNSVAATVVGVAAPGFAGAVLTPPEDVWLPIAAYHRAAGTSAALEDRAQPMVIMAGQRAPGASMGDIRSEFALLASRLFHAFPGAFTTFGRRGVQPMRAPAVDVRAYSAAALLPMGDMAPIFLALFTIVTLLTLLVVSANVANLMLGRAVERQRDVAVRRALGASRARVTRMLVAEGAAIAMVAWAASCVIAWWTARALLRIAEPSAGLLAEFSPDWTIAAYAMALAAAATLAFTLAPALRAWRLQVLPLLRSGEQGVARGRSRLSSGLVVVQLAFSVLLLTSAGLAYRSLTMLDSGHVGFDADPLLLATVRAAQEVHTGRPAAATRQQELARLERVRDRLSEQQRVAAVSYSRRVPGAYYLATTAVRTHDGDRSARMFLRPVGPAYLRSLGLAPVAGRDFRPDDRSGAPAAAIVNAQLAHELFPGTSALGRTLLIGDEQTPVEIVGIAPNALYDGPVHDPAPRYVFLPLQQARDGRFALLDITFFVRYEGALDTMAPLVSRAIADADAALPIVSMSTMRSRLESVTVLERQVTTLLMVFALTSLAVAALGQYAVATFNMRRRTREFGVRLALGASASRVQRSVVREALALTLPGLAIGFVLSAGTANAARTVLFGVTPVDPATYAAVLALLAVTSIAASCLPAWRAGRVNVVEALRQE